MLNIILINCLFNSESEAARQLAFEELKPTLHGESRILGPNSLKQVYIKHLYLMICRSDLTIIFGADLAVFAVPIEN
jgi:hypothetical protein